MQIKKAKPQLQDSTSILPLTDDDAFKAVFGDQKYIENMRKLLKAILDLPCDSFRNLSIVDPFLQRIFKKDKKGILDVKVSAGTEGIIDVEVQVQRMNYFTPRMIYYNSKMITSQLRTDWKYEKIHKTISIAICDHILLDNTDDYLNAFELRNVKTGNRFTDLIKYVTLELPKVPKTDDGSSVWPFASVFKCKKEDELTMLAVKYPQLKGIAAGLRNFNLVDEIRAVIDAKNKAWRDAEAIKDWQRDEGRREGLREGREEARSEADEIIKAKDAALSAKDAALSEKDAALSEKDAALSEKDAEIAALKAQLAKK